MLSYDYAARKAILEDAPPGQLSPHVYVLCVGCAERLRAPRGWDLEDLRAEPPLFLDAVEDVIASTAAPVSESPAEEAAVATARRQLFFGYSA